MNSDKMEINFENLENVSGGTTEEALAYVEKLAKNTEPETALNSTGL